MSIDPPNRVREFFAAVCCIACWVVGERGGNVVLLGFQGGKDIPPGNLVSWNNTHCGVIVKGLAKLWPHAT
jgi:hypothetical protein